MHTHPVLYQGKIYNIVHLRFFFFLPSDGDSGASGVKVASCAGGVDSRERSRLLLLLLNSRRFFLGVLGDFVDSRRGINDCLGVGWLEVSCVGLCSGVMSGISGVAAGGGLAACVLLGVSWMISTTGSVGGADVTSVGADVTPVGAAVTPVGAAVTPVGTATACLSSAFPAPPSGLSASTCGSSVNAALTPDVTSSVLD